VILSDEGLKFEQSLADEYGDKDDQSSSISFPGQTITRVWYTYTTMRFRETLKGSIVEVRKQCRNETKRNATQEMGISMGASRGKFLAPYLPLRTAT
jgi:hypothetical protein